MAFSSARSDPRDLLSKPSVAFLVFWLPAIAIVASGSSHVSDAVRTMVWPGALITMGAACTVNATRCGRLHCYFTGPVFLPNGGCHLVVWLWCLAFGWKWLESDWSRASGRYGRPFVACPGCCSADIGYAVIDSPCDSTKWNRRPSVAKRPRLP